MDQQPGDKDGPPAPVEETAPPAAMKETSAARMPATAPARMPATTPHLDTEATLSYTLGQTVEDRLRGLRAYSRLVNEVREHG